MIAFAPPRLESSVGLVIAFTGVLLGTAVLYALDLFEPAGGLVWVPFHAALVGFAAAAVVGYRGWGVVAALVLAYAPFLGFRLEWALLEISARPLAARLAYFGRPDGLVALAVEAVIVGAAGYVVGRITRRLVRGLRADAVA